MNGKPKSIGHVGRLEIQVEVDVTVLCLNFSGQLGTQAGFLHYSLEAELLVFLETLVFALKTFP